MKTTLNFFESFFYSFPIQLLVNHFKKNHLLLFGWLVLFLIVYGNVGRYLGIPFLFLDPEYMNKVSFTSFFIMGFVLAGFSIAFHITSYIVDGFRFPFLGTLTKPFSRFSLNNSIIPVTFLVVYIFKIIQFQIYNEFATSTQIIIYISGLLVGYAGMMFVMFLYFRLTNKDFFKYVADTFNEKLKRKIRFARARVLEKVKVAKSKDERVDSYLDFSLRFKPAEVNQNIRPDTITKVFDQNHLNLVIIEFIIFICLLFIGIFRDIEYFQLPAAASSMLFLTIIVMFIGAFSYWFRNWALTIAIGTFLVLNFLVKQELFAGKFKAFGMNYDITPIEYSQNNIRKINSAAIRNEDKISTIQILENWKQKHEGKKPKAVLICTSGGGQRASLWALNVLQQADSATQGKLFDHTLLITGASGGIIGASYYRELKLRHLHDNSIDPNDKKYLQKISSDNLNPIIFSFLVNDLFVKFQRFKYKGISYPKDRGYSFEAQLNKNTDSFLDKPLSDYNTPVKNADIPMIIMGPTIINDGRKLFISSQNVSYMNIMGNFSTETPEGIDFLRFYKDAGSHNLRFLSALRMNATFPYITPNITLPSHPAMEIMDAGISDNFGIADAIRYLYAFQDWLEKNTSGIVILSIRDSEVNKRIGLRGTKSLVEKFSNPISSIYINFENLQDISNNDKIVFAKNWYKGTIQKIVLSYIPQSLTGDPKDVARASLSWRLTTREKKDIRKSIHLKPNQDALRKLSNTLQY